jgi:hypothetical protein
VDFLDDRTTSIQELELYLAGAVPKMSKHGEFQVPKVQMPHELDPVFC